MARPREEQQTRQVAIEISRTFLRMASIQHHGSERPVEVHTRMISWRSESSSLHSELGIAELTAAMKTLVAQEKLGGTKVRFTLNGDFCVTRVMTGAADRVRRELAQLEDRSQLYLSLGPGTKALAGSIRQIDARHQHALLSVTNQRTLDALVQAASAVGIQIELVEPSLVALGRVLGQMGYDKDQPAIVVNVSERGVELGISYQGQLLLDYRPGGRSVHNEVADIVAQHMARLQRYCFRYFRFTQGKLDRIFLCGSEEFIGRVEQGFAQHPQLRAEVLDVVQIDPNWQFDGAAPGSDFAAAIGTCLISADSEAERSGPNLMKDFETKAPAPLPSELLATLWPIAAVLLIAVGLFVVNLLERRASNRVEAEIAAIESASTKSRQLHLTLARTESKHRHLAQIARQVHQPAWDELIATLAGCMPDDVWLEKFDIDGGGRVSLSGASYQEGGIYEFAGWLEKSPLLTDVALKATRPGRNQGGSTTTFQLECKFAGHTDSKGGGNGND